LFKIAKSTSLYDIKERKEFITRVICNIHVFEEYILNLIEFIPSSVKIEIKAGKNALKCLESFFSIELVLNWYKPFESKVLENIKNQIDKPNERGFLWRFQFESQKPLINADNSMQKFLKQSDMKIKLFHVGTLLSCD
jgi:hypothetical protein